MSLLSIGVQRLSRRLRPSFPLQPSWTTADIRRVPASLQQAPHCVGATTPKKARCFGEAAAAQVPVETGRADYATAFSMLLHGEAAFALHSKTTGSQPRIATR